MANRHAQRPRAPSPPRSPTFDNFNVLRRQQEVERKSNAAPQLPPARRPLPTTTTSYKSAYEDNYDTDNTYSVVQDDQTIEFRAATKTPISATPKTPNLPTKLGRMFGDSEAENDDKRALGRRLNGSLSSNASSSSSLRGGSLSSLYQARKNGMANYDSATVEQIKAQFQAQIESMLQSQERNSRMGNNSSSSNLVNSTKQNGVNIGPLKNGHIPSAAERELNVIRELQRGKSFVEARTAVQKQIERMFSTAQSGANAVSDKSTKDFEVKNTEDKTDSPFRRFAATASASSSSLLTNPHNGSKVMASGRIQHTMHGVSHALPGEELDIEPPPPVHYGIDQALRNGSVALNSRRSGGQMQQHQSENVKNFFSNDDLRTVGQRDPPTSTLLTKSPALKRLVQSHDSLNVNDTNEQRDSIVSQAGLRSKSREEISVQTDRPPNLGNIDISNRSTSTSSLSQPRLSRSTDAETPSSLKTGEKLEHWPIGTSLMNIIADGK